MMPARLSDSTRLSIPNVLRLTGDAVARNWAAGAIITAVLTWAPALVWDLVLRGVSFEHMQPLDRWEVGAVKSISTLALEWLGIAAVSQLVVSKPARHVGIIAAVKGAGGVYVTLLPFWFLNGLSAWTRLALQLLLAAEQTGHLVRSFHSLVNLQTAGMLLPPLLALPFSMAIGIFVPTGVAERQGLRATLGRSWSLLMGSRWIFLGVFLAVSLAPGLVDLIWRPARGIVVAPLVGMGWTDAKLYIGWPFYLIERLVAAVGWVVIAATYLDLRRLKDGPDHDELSDVFA